MQPQVREPRAETRQAAASAVGASPVAGDERPWVRNWRRNLAIAGAAGVFLALVGAANTGGAPLAQRFLYWIPIMMAGGVLGGLLASAVAHVRAAQSNPWVFGAILTLAVAIPATALVWAWTAIVLGYAIPLEGTPALFGMVLVISAAMTSIMVAVNLPGRTTHAAAPGASDPAPVRFLERLPPKLRGAELHAVSAEDHYLRLHTSKGSDLILMRLSDAIAELEGIEGAQTHRSWWVARHAVESARREGDKAVLTLKGGVVAPVSRANVRPLKEAGWW
jgi:hypothetical protein